MQGLNKKKLLFLCTGNSCRSQMAEGWAKNLLFDSVEAYSAGTNPKGMDPRAIKVMLEAGVDIAGQHSKHIDELGKIEFDLVLTLCGDANDNCPIFPGKAKVMHFGFEDPPRLAKGASSEEDALGYYRRVRDEIREFVTRLPEILKNI
ncbi:Arsenate reductase (Thioredoxin) [uncultured bacterium]|nr:Arsenate reductase (Thioredoxin) [uncultured bacterium]